MKNTIWLGVALLAFAIIFASFWLRDKQNVGYVRTADLINDFAGMKEANTTFQQKTLGWESRLDSISTAYQNKIMMIYQDTVGIAKQELERRHAQVEQIRYHMYMEVERTKKVADEEDKVLTDQVYARINGYIKEYGEKNGYQVILGTTADGNILYADNGIDITDELLIYINNKYEGKE